MGLPEGLETIGSVAQALPAASADTLCEVVDRRFQADPEIGVIAVVDSAQRPIGLINRYELITHLSRDYGRALFAKKPVVRLMDREPLVVDASLTLDHLESLIADKHPQALLRGFIVARDSRYYGVATALSLLHLNMVRTERRSRMLESARRQAEEANLSKTRFLANMSHELRTPLNAIIGFAEVMDREMFGALGNPRYRDYVNDILGSGQHLLGLINNILDMAKIESGTWRINPVELDPGGVLLATCRSLRDRAESRGVTVNCHVDDAVHSGFADPQALRQIVLNLLSNAIKFTLPGGHISVTLRAAADGGFVLAVADSGIGIAPEHIALVLAPFGQVENDLTRRYEGTGLGLPLSKALTEMHGGRFEIESLVNAGTTMRVSFPPPPREPGSPGAA